MSTCIVIRAIKQNFQFITTWLLLGIHLFRKYKKYLVLATFKFAVFVWNVGNKASNMCHKLCSLQIRDETTNMHANHSSTLIVKQRVRVLSPLFAWSEGMFSCKVRFYQLMEDVCCSLCKVQTSEKLAASSHCKGHTKLFYISGRCWNTVNSKSRRKTHILEQVIRQTYMKA